MVDLFSHFTVSLHESARGATRSPDILARVEKARLKTAVSRPPPAGHPKRTLSLNPHLSSLRDEVTCGRSQIDLPLRGVKGTVTNAPFLLMPTFYGGGGFFSIRAGTEDIRLFEGRFEFGAVTAFNLHPA